MAGIKLPEVNKINEYFGTKEAHKDDDELFDESDFSFKTDKPKEVPKPAPPPPEPESESQSSDSNSQDSSSSSSQSAEDDEFNDYQSDKSDSENDRIQQT